jgi:hypothetical protein
VSASQQLLLKFIAKAVLGLLALQLGMALTAYFYIFAAPFIGHWQAFGIGAVNLIGWFAVVITWMGRQWNDWYSR